LLRAITQVEAGEAKADGDERTGIRILKQALEVPSRQIAVRLALEHAVSVAGVLLLAEATLTELPEEPRRSSARSVAEDL
jgi:chaperonin GroEL